MIRLQELEMRDFRGVRHLAVPFTATRTAVLVGANGSGKSSILDCAAILLSRLVARVRTGSAGGRQFSPNDISNGATETSNTVTLQRGDRSFVWTVSRVQTGRSHMTLSSLGGATELASQLRDEITANADASLPVFVYYPVNRAVLDIPLRIRTRHDFEDQLAAYDDSLTGASSSFRVFFEWFRFREDLENETRIEQPRFRDRQLQAVRSAIEALMPGFEGLRIRRSPLRMVVSKEGEEVSVSQLSDGEKCLLALVGDLARRLALANPGMDDPLAGDGVVLIDEIELHLHPVWQRRVIPALERTFPRCQFIVSTHSAPILGHVKPDGVYLLSRHGGDVEVRQLTTYGQDADRILEEVFGSTARPEEVERDLRQLFRVIDDNDLPRARSLADRLASDLGVDDPDLVRARVLLQRKAVLGK